MQTYILAMTLDNSQWKKDNWDTPGLGSKYEEKVRGIFYDCGKWFSHCPYSLSWDHRNPLWEIHFVGWQIKMPVEFTTSPDFLYENYSTDEKEWIHDP